MHPQYGTVFNVDVDLDFTIQEMANNLMECGFVAQDSAGYDLAIGLEYLAENSKFSDIEEKLYDGIILRVVPKKTKPQEKKAIFLHPFGGWHHDLTITPHTTPLALLTQFINTGFIDGGIEDYCLQYKGQELDNETTFFEDVQSGDFVHIINKPLQAAPKTAELIDEVKKDLEKVQKDIDVRLIDIKDQLPELHTIPIDQALALNPTQVPYESPDSIISAIRRIDNLAPTDKVSATSLIPFLLLGLGLGLIATLIVLITSL